MELGNKLKELGEKVEQLKGRIETEESTKHAFTLPFINLLGYDTFNPTEVVPEFTADIGLKKGEKVDYALVQNDEPILIIECKHWSENLDVHKSQLARYFHATQTRFALLTNGIHYRFYTDLVQKNKMDDKPFFEFDITKLKDSAVKEIEKFHKSKFDESLIFDNASNLKYTREIKVIISEEFANPSQDFVKLFANKAYDGRLTAKVVEEFTDIVAKAFSQIITEKVSDRLNSALNKEQEHVESEIETEEEPQDTTDTKIVTTEEEIEGYQIVVAILRRLVSKDIINYRDTQSYFGILFDDNNRKPICRLHLNANTKYISTFDENKKETKTKIESIDDIYEFEDELLAVTKFYLES